MCKYACHNSVTDNGLLSNVSFGGYTQPSSRNENCYYLRGDLGSPVTLLGSDYIEIWFAACIRALPSWSFAYPSDLPFYLEVDVPVGGHAPCKFSSSSSGSSSDSGLSSSSVDSSNYCDMFPNDAICERYAGYDDYCLDPKHSGESFCKLSLLCSKNPYLPECGNPLPPGGIPPGFEVPGSDSSGVGSGCKDLSNCDWAKLSYQLKQLGIEGDILMQLGSIFLLLQNDYNISRSQDSLLRSVLGSLLTMENSLSGLYGKAVQSHASDSLFHHHALESYAMINDRLFGISQGINSITSWDGGLMYILDMLYGKSAQSNERLQAIGDYLGSIQYQLGNLVSYDGYFMYIQGNLLNNTGNAARLLGDVNYYLGELLSSVNSLGDRLGSDSGSGGSSAGSGASSGSGGCDGDDCVPGGIGPADLSGLDGKANTIIQGGGRDFSVWSNSQIGSLIPSSISVGQCPVINQTIKFGGKSHAVKIDFNNLVPGSSFNLAAFIRAVLLISVYFLNIITMIRIFQSGGRG
jgi:hypothetical protein